MVARDFAAVLRAHRDDDMSCGFYDAPDPACSCGYDLAPDDALTWIEHVAAELEKVSRD